MALIRTFLVCFLQNTNFAVRTSDDLYSRKESSFNYYINELLAKKTYIFAVLFWGNIADNAQRMRPFIVVCELAIAVCFMIEMVLLGFTKDVKPEIVEDNYA
jgi:hypothetical protein